MILREKGGAFGRDRLGATKPNDLVASFVDGWSKCQAPLAAEAYHLYEWPPPYLLALFKISQVLVGFQGVATSLSEAFQLADAVLSMQTVMLLEQKKHKPRLHVWHAENIEPSSLHSLQAGFLVECRTYLDLKDVDETAEGAAFYSMPRRKEDFKPERSAGPVSCVVPLHDPNGGVIGVIGFRTALPLRTDEMRFIAAFTEQICRALRSHQAWLDELVLREAAQGKLEKLVHELERSNAELQEFGYSVSHDLQEPLRMITSYLVLLERRHKSQLNKEALDYMGFAVEGSVRMKLLIDSLLHYSKVGTKPPKFEPVDFSRSCEHAVKNLEVSIRESEAMVTYQGLPKLMAWEVRIVELFQNLLSNAIKFRGAARPEINVTATRQSQEWLFSVRDNGIGLDHKYAKRIFLLFQRLHSRAEYPGTGVGLSICKKVVELHGGRIWVESTEGQGSTFFFTLPDDPGKPHRA